MAQCNFSLSFNQPIEQLIEKAKDAITSRDGTFNGNNESGDYSISTPLGSIKGIYTVAGTTINFTIIKKPLLVSCNRIEDELRRYIN